MRTTISIGTEHFATHRLRATVSTVLLRSTAAGLPLYFSRSIDRRHLQWHIYNYFSLI